MHLYERMAVPMRKLLYQYEGLVWMAVFAISVLALMGIIALTR